MKTMMNSGLVFTVFAIAAAGVSANNLFAPPKSRTEARDAYNSRLLERARPVNPGQGVRRRIDETVPVTIANAEDYSFRFETCQSIQTWDDELASAEPFDYRHWHSPEDSPESFLATRSFVIFRLCPSSTEDGDCDNSCESGFEEYIIDLEEYLLETIRYQQQAQKEMCKTCNSSCSDRDGNMIVNNNNEDDIEIEEEEIVPIDEIEAVTARSINGGRGGGFRRLQDSGVDCECSFECTMIENMYDYGYVDASDFIECQMINDPEDDDMQELYAGPICASEGSKITIAVFSDEDCRVPYPNKNVEDYIMDGDGNNVRLSHHMLKKMYSTDCVSCRDGQIKNSMGDVRFDTCNSLHSAAAKCELENENLKYIYTARSSQLLAQGIDFSEGGEECLLKSKFGRYKEGGAIYINAPEGGAGTWSSVTEAQTTVVFPIWLQIVLAFFAVLFIVLLVYAVALQRKINSS